MPNNFRLKIKHGKAKFEAEGTQKCVEAKLQEFKPMLKLPRADKPEKIKTNNTRRGQEVKASYLTEAIIPLG